MAKAGYANGFSVDMPFYAGVGMDSLFPVVIQQLGLINIKVHEVTLTGPNAISELLSGKYPLLMWPLGNYGNTLSDIAQAILQPSIWNVEHQPDATIQSLYTKMLNSTTAAQYKANLQAIYRYTIDQAWFVPIVYQNVYFAYNPKTVSIPSVSDFQYLNPLLWDFRLR
jgi:peptide/nickel transport system substrate-binding protein